MAPTFSQLQGTTHFLIKSAFGEKAEMDLDSFRETVQKFADIDERYPHFLTQMLIKQHYLDEARYVAEKYRLHNFIKSLSYMGPGKKCPSQQPPPSNLYYQLPISEHAISFVNTLPKFHSAFDHLLLISDRESVGVDSEWPPNVLPNAVSSTAIIQLALIDRVYILDLDNLSAELSTSDWSLLTRFFSSTKIRKITHGFNSDISVLKQSFSRELGSFELGACVDLEKLVPEVWDALRCRGYGQISLNNNLASLNASSNPISPKNLAEIARTFLGRPLNKAFRMSNWNRRPLVAGQLIYAAIDAYCLLKIYREISRVITSKKLLIPSHLSLINSEDFDVPGSVRVKAAPGDVPLICDSFLWDLGDYLQKLGFDVELVDIAELSQQDGFQNKTVLTVQHHFGQPSCSSENRIIGVPLRDIKEQVKFVASCLGIDVDTERVTMNYFGHANALLDDISKERGFDLTFDCEEDPSRPQSDTVFMAKCSMKKVSASPDGSISCITNRTKAMGRSKREAFARAAANMIVLLDAASTVETSNEKSVKHIPRRQRFKKNFRRVHNWLT